MGAMQENFWVAFIAALTLVLGAAYSLWMIKRVFYGEVINQSVSQLKEIGVRQFFILLSLAMLVLVVGVYPKIISDITNVSVEHFVQFINLTKIPTS